MCAQRAGTRLSFTYECRDDQGKLLEALTEPATITLGEGEVLAALERALGTMRPGDTRELVLEPEQAFGPHEDGLVGFFAFDVLPDDPPPALGDVLEVEAEGEDEPMLATVVAIEEDGCMLDGNHPLAGQRLYYTLRLVAPPTA